MSEMYEYFVAVEGHLVVAQITNFGPCHLYIDDALRDTYHPEASNLGGQYNLLEPGLFARDWRTILCGSIIPADGDQALIEFQIRSNLSRVHCRILAAGKVMKRWKNRRG